MIDSLFLERRRFGAAARGSVTTARRERASDDRLGKRWHRAGDFGQPGAFASSTTIDRTELRDGVQQSPRVRVSRAREQFED
jgi:hypothetical protein